MNHDGNCELCGANHPGVGVVGEAITVLLCRPCTVRLDRAMLGSDAQERCFVANTVLAKAVRIGAVDVREQARQALVARRELARVVLAWIEAERAKLQPAPAGEGERKP